VKRLLLALLALLALAPAAAQSTLPMDKGLPVRVQAAVSFVEINSFDENSAKFHATVDVRLRWKDLRLRQPTENAGDPPQVMRGADADSRLAGLWSPNMSIVNLDGDPSYTSTGLRIYPDGTIELMKRVSGDFNTDFDATRFPFDRQKLTVQVAVRDQTTDTVALEFDQSDLDFSQPAEDSVLDGWSLGLVSLKSDPMPGWYLSESPRVTASLEITRYPGLVVAAIFIPLFASLLIPLLAIWLNHIEDGRFAIETFELVNLIIGGLFAIIALNFTIYGSYGVLAVGDNAVNRLFALNYVALAVALLVNVLFYRFHVFEKLFGRYVQEQLYLFLTWAIPVLVLSVAGAVMLVTVV
jgi:hypothetical protein